MIRKIAVLFIILGFAACAVCARPAVEKAGLELDINSLEANAVVRKAGNLIVSSNASVFIAKNNIEKTLKSAFGVDDLFSADLASCAEKYLLSIGMTSDEIQRLKANL